MFDTQRLSLTMSKRFEFQYFLPNYAIQTPHISILHTNAACCNSLDVKNTTNIGLIGQEGNAATTVGE